MDDKTQIKECIGNNRLDIAIDLLKKHFKADKTLYNQIALFENQFNTLEQHYSKNDISFEEYSR